MCRYVNQLKHFIRITVGVQKELFNFDVLRSGQTLVALQTKTGHKLSMRFYSPKITQHAILLTKKLCY